MMSIDLNGRIPYFSKSIRLIALNDIVSLHQRLTPNIVMMSTGCSFKQALQVLWLLFEFGYAQAFILVYLKDDPEVFIERRSLFDGLPEFPLVYDFGSKIVETSQDVLYSFEFVRNADPVTFTDTDE